MPRLLPLSLSAAIGAAAFAPPALADRLPTPEERAAIETVLEAAHFASWGAIVLDDDSDDGADVPYWEVDDARTTEGMQYDLKLTPGTLDIVSQELDH